MNSPPQDSSMTNLSLNFETDEHAQRFLEWFLDGGGEDEYSNFLKAQGQPYDIVKHDMNILTFIPSSKP